MFQAGTESEADWDEAAEEAAAEAEWEAEADRAEALEEERADAEEEDAAEAEEAVGEAGTAGPAPATAWHDALADDAAVAAAIAAARCEHGLSFGICLLCRAAGTAGLNASDDVPPARRRSLENLR